MKHLELSNGAQIPMQMMGTSVWDRVGDWKTLQSKMNNAISYCVTNGLAGLDTSRDYHNESQLGIIFQKLISSGECSRDNIYITTKVGNGQQRYRRMADEISQSLKALRLEYVDLWLLHWPLPDYWIDNWKQLCDIYETGKVKAIGIANCRERHLEELLKNGLPLPHVVQIEHHPFRTVPNFLKICAENYIQVEAYSSNCLMLPFVRNNNVLNRIASSHNKSVAQIMTRWHIQHRVIPIFSSFSINHIKENIDVYDFELSDEEMQQIFALDEDYKYHPESLNCPGY